MVTLAGRCGRAAGGGPDPGAVARDGSSWRSWRSSWAWLWRYLGHPRGDLSSLLVRDVHHRLHVRVDLDPRFFFSSMLVYFFTYKFRVFETPRYVPFVEDPITNLTNIILPVIALSHSTIAFYTRFIRSSVLDVMGQDYIRTARAKGLREFSVVLRHGLRNALIPSVTLIGLTIVTLWNGAFVTERIFNWPDRAAGRDGADQPRLSGDPGDHRIVGVQRDGWDAPRRHHVHPCRPEDQPCPSQQVTRLLSARWRRLARENGRAGRASSGSSRSIPG
jgi:hypothetical protein